ncbi:hypothetical protein FOQG_13931 [Fusarium oxysporum f. sp. raphani 54005]|uniref:Peptidase A1 domain-containing protein n=2 Tax=Fusarium oxysporum f. sp. raphani TaxID=96318 RepID=X0BRT5_FUSOX|nr:hypothetical protein FOQG_13931 [Fusarium oxysporum f. sp. raphani 54005]KAG7427742.1 putative aspartic-type endopeptidase opsB [Fusarium oxysporum f. sp. raphani]
MKASSLVLSSTLLSCANALQLHKRHNPSIVSVNFEKRTKDVFPGHENTFGVGLYTREHAEIRYPNLPYALAEAGEINTPAFSLWLDNKTHGEFLFGGVKKAKYIGPLVSYPVVVDNQIGLRDRALVVMTGFGTTSDGKTSDLDFEPRPISIDEKLDAVAPCETSSKETLHFTFGDLTIKVPFANFLGSNNVKAGVDGVAYCQVVYYDDTTNIMLGDDFLRGAYVIYDWANMEISLSQYNSEEAKDYILEIIRDVPGASAATGVPRRYLKYDQPAESAGTAVPTELLTVTVTSLSTAAGSVTGSAAPSSTAAEAGEVEDNGAAGSLLANLMYMMLIAFAFNVVIYA